MATYRARRDGQGIARRAARALAGARDLPVCYLNVGHANLHPRLWQNLRGLRRVVLIHDTIPLDHPEFTRAGQSAVFAARFAAALSHAELVLTVSAATRADVLRWRERLGLPARARVEPVPWAQGLPRRARPRRACRWTGRSSSRWARSNRARTTRRYWTPRQELARRLAARAVATALHHRSARLGKSCGLCAAGRAAQGRPRAGTCRPLSTMARWRFCWRAATAF